MVLPILTLRLVEIRLGKTWYSYITSTLSPSLFHLLTWSLVRRRWRIRRSFPAQVLRLLVWKAIYGPGSINGVEIPCLGDGYYMLLRVDLGDAVAEELTLPFILFLWRWCILVYTIYRL